MLGIATGLLFFTFCFCQVCFSRNRESRPPGLLAYPHYPGHKTQQRSHTPPLLFLSQQQHAICAPPLLSPQYSPCPPPRSSTTHPFPNPKFPPTRPIPSHPVQSSPIQFSPGAARRWVFGALPLGFPFCLLVDFPLELCEYIVRHTSPDGYMTRRLPTPHRDFMLFIYLLVPLVSFLNTNFSLFNFLPFFVLALHIPTRFLCTLCFLFSLRVGRTYWSTQRLRRRIGRCDEQTRKHASKQTGDIELLAIQLTQVQFSSRP